MYLEVKCWNSKQLTPKKILEISKKINLPVYVIEREIIFYDTLYVFSKFSPTKIALKGGSLISRIYSEYPRFSWDIDLTSNIQKKSEYDLRKLNTHLKNEGRTHTYNFNSISLETGLIERDVEKNVFKDILSLRRPLTTYQLGTALPIYLRLRGYNINKLAGKIIKLKEKYGRLPCIDFVRATISLMDPADLNKLPVRKIPSLVEEGIPPECEVKISVYHPEYCLIDKVSRLSQPFDTARLRDLSCDFYDIGQLLKQSLNLSLVKERYKLLYTHRAIQDIEYVKRRVEENIRQLLLRPEIFKERREFIAAEKQYDWKEYLRKTLEELKNVLESI